jgi:hypothetical protein
MDYLQFIIYDTNISQIYKPNIVIDIIGVVMASSMTYSWDR